MRFVLVCDTNDSVFTICDVLYVCKLNLLKAIISLHKTCIINCPIYKDSFNNAFMNFLDRQNFSYQDFQWRTRKLQKACWGCRCYRCYMVFRGFRTT